MTWSKCIEIIRLGTVESKGVSVYKPRVVFVNLKKNIAITTGFQLFMNHNKNNARLIKQGHFYYAKTNKQTFVNQLKN